MIVAGGAHDLTSTEVFTSFLDDDLTVSIGIGVASPLVAPLRIFRQKGYLGIKYVENQAPA